MLRHGVDAAAASGAVCGGGDEREREREARVQRF